MLGIVGAFKNSCSGLSFAWKEDRSWRNTLLQFAVAVIVALGLLLTHHIGLMLWPLLTASVFPMVIVETINCSIEAVTDKASPERSKLAKKAKDLASASVLLSRIFALMCWITVLTQIF